MSMSVRHIENEPAPGSSMIMALPVDRLRASSVTLLLGVILVLVLLVLILI